MSDTDNIFIKPKRHLVPLESFPEGDDAEVVGERVFGGRGQY